MAISPTGVKITINTFAQFLGRISSSATTFIITILLAQSLGSEGYGDFSKILTYTSFFYLLADFGMNAAFLQLKEEDKRFTFSHLLGLRLSTAFALVVLSISILSFFPQGSIQGYTPLVRLGIILYSLSIIFHSLITSLNALFQEKLRYELAAIAVIGGSLFRLIITALFGTGSVPGAIFCFFLGTVATFLFAMPLAKRLEQNLTPVFSLRYCAKILKRAFPLGLTLAFNLIYFRVDSVILTLSQSTQDVGIYNLAYSFFEVALVIPVFFMNALYPLLLQRKGESLEKFFSLAKKAAIVLGLLSGIATACVWVGAPILSLVKAEFSPGIGALRILGLSLPFFYLTSVTMWMLVALKKSKELIAIYGISMIINIAANIVFVPKIGFIAAAWITFFGEGIVLLFSLIILISQARQTLSIRRILAS
jgi:O-antigen/teichoic acid export membrane protein